MSTPQGFERFLPKDQAPLEMVALLLRAICGTKNAAAAFWQALLKVIKTIGLDRSKADPCLCFAWTKEGKLAMAASWVDDLKWCGHKETALEFIEKFKEHFKCDDVGAMTECVGCKIACTPGDNRMVIANPVLPVPDWPNTIWV